MEKYVDDKDVKGTKQSSLWSTTLLGESSYLFVALTVTPKLQEQNLATYYFPQACRSLSPGPHSI